MLPKHLVSHGLEHIRVNGRMEIVHTSKRCTVLVDYAHNAVSMESLLATLREYHPKRLVVVFGCGGNRSRDRRYSMSKHSFMKLAQDARAVYKINRITLVNVKIFEEYLESFRA